MSYRKNRRRRRHNRRAKRSNRYLCSRCRQTRQCANCGRVVKGSDPIDWIKRAKEKFEIALEVLNPMFVDRLEQQLEVAVPQVRDIIDEEVLQHLEVPRREIKETRRFLQTEVELIEQEDWEELERFHDPQFDPLREVEFGFMKRGLIPFLRQRNERTPIKELKNLHDADLMYEFNQKFSKQNLALVTNGLGSL